MGKHSQYNHLAYLPVEDVIIKIKQEPSKEKAIFIVNGEQYKINVDSTRVRLFKNNRTCVRCGIVGNIFAIDNQITRPNKNPHLNLYHYNPETKEYIMMTKDHVIPDSKGGKDHLSNLQCMCEECNERKKNKNDQDGTAEDLFFVNIKRAVGMMCNNFKNKEVIMNGRSVVEFQRREKDILVLMKAYNTEQYLTVQSVMVERKLFIPITSSFNFGLMCKFIEHNINELQKENL